MILIIYHKKLFWIENNDRARDGNREWKIILAAMYSNSTVWSRDNNCNERFNIDDGELFFLEIFKFVQSWGNSDRDGDCDNEDRDSNEGEHSDINENDNDDDDNDDNNDDNDWYSINSSRVVDLNNNDQVVIGKRLTECNSHDDDDSDDHDDCDDNNNSDGKGVSGESDDEDGDSSDGSEDNCFRCFRCLLSLFDFWLVFLLRGSLFL